MYPLLSEYSTEACPCCSGSSYSDCCAPLHYHHQIAQSAVALMRSRYSAFALGGLGHYLIETWHPEAPDAAQLNAAGLSVREVDWKALEILDDREKGDKATVEFRASFHLPDPNESLRTLRERSRFVKERGRWYYIRGDIIDEMPASKKQGRNEPCTCGSGKKYKRCCGQ